MVNIKNPEAIKKNFTVRFTERDIKRIEKISKSQNISKADLIRNATKLMLEIYEKKMEDE